MHQRRQVAASKDLAQYCYLKRKTVEISSTLGGVAPMTTPNAVHAIEEDLERGAKGLPPREPDTRNI